MMDQSASSALIGYTGFIGGNLLAQAPFQHLYNTSNLANIRGQGFDLLVCAAPSGTKWRANKQPIEDLESVTSLMDELSQTNVARFVLISTVDVYATPTAVDEDTEIDIERLAPYGRHRRTLELFVQERFKATIVRLPALFGPGLKKNSIYDLLRNDHRFLQPDAELQYYDLGRLWNDIGCALSHDLSVVNFVTEPMSVREVARQVFGVDLPRDGNSEAPRYDVRSRHGNLWGGGPYLYQKDQVTTGLQAFVSREKTMERAVDATTGQSTR